MNKIISLENVYAGYDGKNVLEKVSLDVYEDDFLGVIGPNGGGKTTLVKVMLGLMKPASGTVRYYRKGNPASDITMGYLPQYSEIDRNFPISVRDVVLSGLRCKGGILSRYTAEQRMQADETISRMELDGLEACHIGALSGGQLQRVLLARAIVSKPEMLMLDEPNTYIDKRFQEQMYDMLVNINRECAIVMVSHDVGSVLQNVKSIACVNHTLHYHPGNEVSGEWIEKNFGCPIDILGHGDMPHRVLKSHGK